MRDPVTLYISIPAEREDWFTPQRISELVRHACLMNAGYDALGPTKDEARAVDPALNADARFITITFADEAADV